MFIFGVQCERCKPLFNNKPFLDGTGSAPNECQPCQCHNHSTTCVYMPALDVSPNDRNSGGGGMCQNCLHYMVGNQCQDCKQMYFREDGKSLDAEDVCRPCDCHTSGTLGTDLICAMVRFMFNLTPDIQLGINLVLFACL